MQTLNNNNGDKDGGMLGALGSLGMMSGRCSPQYRGAGVESRRIATNTNGPVFGGYEDSHALFGAAATRLDAGARVDTTHALTELTSPIKTSPGSASGHQKQEGVSYGQSPLSHQDLQASQQIASVSRHHHMPLHAFGAPPGSDVMLDTMGASMQVLTSEACHASSGLQPGHHMYSHYPHGMPCQSAAMATAPLAHPALSTPHPTISVAGATHPAALGPQEMDCDPRELEAFAERFKQRRIKLGVTQADVGNALGKLKLPGVGSLSQSTICRFESLTLSHNNMIALKPILIAWLEEAEQRLRDKNASEGVMDGDKKRKRTSIAAPEKRSLEAYFSVQPRPSGEKIAQIAEKLDLKKSVVRVWFCNQRQKQKRLKFSALPLGSAMSPSPASAHNTHSPNGMHH